MNCFLNELNIFINLGFMSLMRAITLGKASRNIAPLPAWKIAVQKLEIPLMFSRMYARICAGLFLGQDFLIPLLSCQVPPAQGQFIEQPRDSSCGAALFRPKKSLFWWVSLRELKGRPTA